MLPMGSALLLAVVLAAPTAAAPAKPGSTAAAEKAVKEAKRRQDAVEKALEDAISRRQVAEARRREAGERLARSTAQLHKLQAVVSARARSTYMTGSPTSVARVVGENDVGDLLDKMETIYQLAERSNQTLVDLRALEGVAEESRSTLARVEKELREVEKELQARLKEADDAVDERVRAFDELRAKDAARAIEVAGETAAEAAAGVVGGGGGVCDLSGVPADAHYIIMQESGGRSTAQNPSSTAFGLGQLLIGNRRRYLGANYATTDCGLQYKAFLSYVNERYGSVSAAAAFKRSHGWY
jgi:peptidoglycan hydrolase CwlO-like protein